MKTKGFLGFLVGGLIGAGIALLYAPQSGEETRQSLTDETQKLTEKARNSLQESQARLEALNQETKERLAKIQEIAKSTLEKQKESLEKGYTEVKEVMTHQQEAEAA